MQVQKRKARMRTLAMLMSADEVIITVAKQIKKLSFCIILVVWIAFRMTIRKAKSVDISYANFV